MLIVLLALGALAGVTMPSQAFGFYECEDSEPAGVAVNQPGTFDLIAAAGPSCSVLVTCPMTATSCDLTAGGRVVGVGLVGLRVSAAGVGSSCSGAMSCNAGGGGTLHPGEQTTVMCSFAPASDLGLSAAALAHIYCVAVLSA